MVKMGFSSFAVLAFLSALQTCSASTHMKHITDGSGGELVMRHFDIYSPSEVDSHCTENSSISCKLYLDICGCSL